jgi:integrase
LPTRSPTDSSSQGLAGLREVVTDVSSHNLRKTFATRLLSRGAAITDVQHLLGHASVKTTEKAYAAFVKNERFKQTIDLGRVEGWRGNPLGEPLSVSGVSSFVPV